MKLTTTLKNTKAAVLLLAAIPAMAQYSSQPPLLAPQELDNLVSRIALYPDPLLAQVLAAATYPNDIPDAARWADDRRGMRSDDLAAAINGSNLPWDASIQALLPFPEVLDTMARDMNWTARLGDAFMVQRDDVMDAVQRMRRMAEEYGYLRSNQQVRVSGDPGYIEIMPYDPAMIYVPVYDPYVVYTPPRPGVYVGGAIVFGRGFSIGFGLTRWGWGGGFDWRSHNVIVRERVWDRRVSHPVTMPTYRRETVVVERHAPAVDRGWTRDDRSFRPTPAPAPAPRMENSYRPAPPAARVESAPRREMPRHEESRGRDNGGAREGRGRGH